jgi:hypothetical protein
MAHEAWRQQFYDQAEISVKGVSDPVIAIVIKY